MRKSLDEIDRIGFHPGPSPLDTAGKEVALQKLAADFAPNTVFSLDGSWDFLEKEEQPREEDWLRDGFCGQVPCGVHMALWKAGKIPDPMVGQNSRIAKEHSFCTWWLRKKFSFSPVSGKRYRLSFEGVADRCTVWLNGKEIASHRGMFGGPDVEVTELLARENELVVRLLPIPYRHWEHSPIPDNNNSWRDSVVINNVYGWHYFNMPSLGIWQPVKIVQIPAAELERPFVYTRDPQKGRAGMLLELHVSRDTRASMQVEIAPHNFSGDIWAFSDTVSLEKGDRSLQYEFTLPDPQLWWPNGVGKPNLYRISVSCTAEGETSVQSCLFGLRSIEMAPLPGGPDEETYNWSFEINGRKVFIKGANWCTIDALLDLRRERYDRFLTLARDQHINLLRAWGAGMPETDDFYDLCSEYGIMVLQEWPTAWNSHTVQPLDLLEDTVVRAMKRLRSYPALTMYGAGNESENPFGEAIDMMGRYAVELDGTRPFHRGQPWGGSQHDYACYWDDQHIDHHLNATAPFWGEFGFASLPSRESFLRYMPKESLKIFPLENNPDFVLHTPMFGWRGDISHVVQSASYFAHPGCKWDEFITSSQLIHALAVRRVLERSRVRDPQCAGVVYYKLTDNSPAVSWACVDYYGVPKLGHYVFQDSYEPLHACVLFERSAFQGLPVRLPVYLLDDAGELPKQGWEVSVRAYNGELKLIKESCFTEFPKESGMPLGRFCMTQKETNSTPLLLVCDLQIDGLVRSRSFYFSNFEKERGCLFSLPRASVSLSSKEERKAVISNNGDVPAVGVLLTAPKKNHLARFEDNFLWLEPGETRELTVLGVDLSDVEVEGLNLL